MNFLKSIQLIQGGMGVYVSNWRMAKAVSMEMPGKTAGTVSGIGLDLVYLRLLQLGDPGGHVRRAMSALDEIFGVTIGQKICARYLIEGRKAPSDRFMNAPLQFVRGLDGSDKFPMPSNPQFQLPSLFEKIRWSCSLPPGLPESG